MEKQLIIELNIYLLTQWAGWHGRGLDATLIVRNHPMTVSGKRKYLQ